MFRQLLRNRRALNAFVYDTQGNMVLKVVVLIQVKRPIKWFLNSSVYVYTPDDRVIGQVHQVWHLWRRKYDLFVGSWI